MYGTILVVDDNDEILTALKICLKGTFSKVLTLNTPEKILPTLQQEAVDIVLLDMNFFASTSCESHHSNVLTSPSTRTISPNTGQEGLMWLRVIKKRHPDIPVVLITAYADVQLAVRGLKSGAADFVTKPWDNDELLRVLKDAIDRSKSVVPLDEMEIRHIQKVLDRCHGNITKAAELLGITRQTLYSKIKKI